MCVRDKSLLLIIVKSSPRCTCFSAFKEDANSSAIVAIVPIIYVLHEYSIIEKHEYIAFVFHEYFANIARYYLKNK